MASAQRAGTNSFPGTGGAIAFSTAQDGFPNVDTYCMNADGFGQTRLTDQPSPNFNPSWSADGKKIAYQSQRTGNFEIYREGHGWRQPDEPY